MVIMEDDMKRCLALVAVVACLMLLMGCTLPIGKEVAKPEDTVGVNEANDAITPVESQDVGANNKEEDKKENSADISENALMIPVTLYYQDIDGYLIPMTRWVDKQPGIARAALDGLTDSAITREELRYYGIYPVLPVNTEVLGINIKDGIAIVDLIVLCLVNQFSGENW